MPLHLICICLLLLASGSALCYPRNLLSAKLGARVTTSSALAPGDNVNAILSDGPVSKGGFRFARSEEEQAFTVDLGELRTFDRLQIGSAGAGSGSNARYVRIEVATKPDGPFRTILLKRDLGYLQVLRLPRVSAQWVRLSFGRGPDGAHVHSVRLYEGYHHPKLAEATRLLRERLSRDVPDLKPFHSAADSGDWAQACRLLRAYYAAKYKADPPDPKYDLARAQALSEGKLDFAGIARRTNFPIDWSYQRTTDWYEHKNFLNRGSPLGIPADACYHTGDPRWAGLFRDIFYDWLDENPKPDVPIHADFPTWRTLDSALRSQWLVSRFDKVTACELIDDELWANYLLCIWEHADYLRQDDFDGGNWLAMVSSAVMDIALKFPEFSDNKVWLAFGKQSFETNVLRDIRPDGKEVEDAPGYVCMAYAGMFGTLRALDKAGIRVEPEVKARMSKVLDFLGAVLQPNGVFPMIGDWGGQIPFDLHEPARYFGRDDIRYILTQGKEGTQPRSASANFPDGGWSVMRSSYDEQPYQEARHLVFKTSSDSHGHLDMLSITAYAYGRELLIDPGIASYEGADVERYVPTAYHNTICIDGRSQSRGGGRTEKWLSSDGIDYVVGAHQGYKGITHRRSIVFVKPDYWLLRDQVTGEGTHTCEQNFHFPPDAAVSGDASAGTVHTGYASGGNLLLVPFEPRAAAASMFDFLVADSRMANERGTPSKGWRYTTSGPLPVDLAVLLYPYRGPAAPSLTAARMKVEPREARAAAYRVTAPDYTDYIVVSEDGASPISVPDAGIDCDGEVVVVRQASGAPPRAFGANVKRVTLKGTVLDVADAETP